MNATGTISLAAIKSLYGEECNICLSQFQVGDRAAWRKDHANAACESVGTAQGMCVIDNDTNGGDKMNISAGNEAAGHRCTHVFHEECISRWLLVRDGCPICRRSYLLDEVDDAAANDSVVPSTVTATGTIIGANHEIDLELGGQPSR